MMMARCREQCARYRRAGDEPVSDRRARREAAKSHPKLGVPSLRAKRSNPYFLAARWIASRSLSSSAHSRDPLARNDGLPAEITITTIARLFECATPASTICDADARVMQSRNGTLLRAEYHCALRIV